MNDHSAARCKRPGCTETVQPWLDTEFCSSTCRDAPMEPTLTSALPILVEPTDPPTHCVRVLGTELYIGPAHADRDMYVLVCLGPGPQIQAVRGPAILAGKLPEPCTPAGASPVALIRLLRAQPCVRQSDITHLTPEGPPAQSTPA
ncbi:MAG TPA: hypothetical protein VGX25_13325 [Actinophytocola sp.]|uniref:hypothetical protein n=1 Tax=Actinophytocola sp. TaxID=1872138 RepID=UPI002DDD2C5B|nr:hypothetical protein [Actinophytocola sp.]HEV2780366.1 hypothetical protein [Actinophytocola sp.]